jgi:hypothetical protein
MKRYTALMVIALAPVVTACGDAGGAGRWAGTIDTLENGVVLVSNPAEGIWTDETAWRLVEDLRIGSVEGEGPELFAAVVDVEADDVGRIYVLERNAQEIRVFDQDGQYVRTIGRQGEGPGEFKMVVGMDFSPDGQLWTIDEGLYRWSLFDTSGVFLQSLTQGKPVSTWSWRGEVMQSGELWDFIVVMTDSGYVDALARYDTVGGYLDTLVLPVRGVYESYFRFEDTRGATVTGIPFAPNVVYDAAPTGAVWIGGSSEYRIAQVGLGGDTMRVVERAHSPLPVTRHELDSAVAAVSERSRGQPVDRSRIPATKPAFLRLVADDEGYLWVQVPLPRDSVGTTFDVFDPQGRYLGDVHTPLNFSVFGPVQITGNQLYAVHTDEMEVPFVVRLRVEGR